MRFSSFVGVAAALFFAGCSETSDGPGNPIQAGPSFGAVQSGQFHEGPVDFKESVYANACAPYPSTIRTITGNMLAGVSSEIAPPGSLCDACIEVTTGLGKTAILRVVTYGQTNDPGDIDVSPEANDVLDSGEYPRAMTWRLIECDNAAPIYVQFKTGANVWWTSLWIRNPSQAVASVEVRNAKYPSFHALELGTDGSYTDEHGFGDGPFTIRVTGEAGATYEFEVAGVDPGALISTGGNLPL